jgi:hypothetical protein
LCILGGLIVSNASEAAAIGSGFAIGTARSRGITLVENLTIGGGIITAVASSGAGIGAGTATNGTANVINLTISGGSVTASGFSGAGIGGGFGNTSVRRLTILGGNVNASGFGGAGVGAGPPSDFEGATVVDLVILDGLVTARGSGAPGIGGPSVRLSGGVVRSYATLGHSPIEGSSIALSGSIKAITTSPPLFGSSPSGADSFDVTILYERTTVQVGEPLDGLGGQFVQVGNLALPFDANWNIRLWSEGHAKEFEIDSAEIASFIASVPGPGSYSIPVWTETTFGRLDTPEGQSMFSVGDAAVFIPAAIFVALDGPPTQTPRPATETQLTADPQTEGGLSPGEIVGVTFGVFLVVGLVIILSVIGVRRYRRARTKNDYSEATPLVRPGHVGEVSEQAV